MPGIEMPKVGAAAVVVLDNRGDCLGNRFRHAQGVRIDQRGAQIPRNRLDIREDADRFIQALHGSKAGMRVTSYALAVFGCNSPVAPVAHDDEEDDARYPHKCHKV